VKRLRFLGDVLKVARMPPRSNKENKEMNGKANEVESRSASAPGELNGDWTASELYWAWRRGEIAAAEF
jgi:hypothetical protein